jgi:hypothetical protein
MYCPKGTLSGGSSTILSPFGTLPGGLSTILSPFGTLSGALSTKFSPKGTIFTRLISKFRPYKKLSCVFWLPEVSLDIIKTGKKKFFWEIIYLALNTLATEVTENTEEEKKENDTNGKYPYEAWYDD